MAEATQYISKKDAQRFLQVALDALMPVRARILEHYRSGVATELKGDRSPVTAADREAEHMLREAILSEFPTHGFFGEEHGITNEGSDFRWVVDPIDGTQSFIHGIPTFGTMIALECRGESVVGIIDHPALNRCYAAASDCGATCNGEKLSITDSQLTSDGWIDRNEVLCTTTRHAFSLNGSQHVWDALVQRTPLYRIYYDCFGLSQAVSGSAAAMMEMNVHTWDIAAIPIITREAGGVYEELPRWTDSQGYERRSAIFGKPTPVARLQEFFEQVR